MNENGIEVAKTLGVNGTVLGVTTLSDLEIILKLVLLTATIIWTGIKIMDALDRGREPKKEKRNAKIHRPENREKEASELRKKRNGSGEETGKSGNKNK